MISVQTLKTISSFVLISVTVMFHYCSLDYSLMLFWRNIVENLISSTETFLIFIVFVVLTPESLMFLCSSRMILWCIFEEPLLKLGKFVCKRFWSLKFLMCWSSNFDVSLQLDWLIVVDDSLNRRWWDLDDFYVKIAVEISFVVVISETLMFHCCFVDDSLMTLWGDIIETLIIAMEAFLIFIVIVVLFCEPLMFHCFSIFSIDESLITPWRNIDGTTTISMQTVKIIEVSNVLIIRTLMFICCLIYYSLVILWWIFDNTLMISMQT